MIGMFFTNAQKMVAFSLIDDERNIESILYSSDSRMVTFNLSDGSEELMTTEVEAPIHEALIANELLYIGNVDAEMQMTSEYEAKIVHV